jgi:hypothetical protein
MNYNKDGEEQYFNSSGMFNIKGEANGKTISIDKDKSMTIDYELAMKNADIDFYSLTTENKWNLVSEIEPIRPHKKIIKVNEIKNNKSIKRAKEPKFIKAPQKPIKSNDEDNRVISIVFDDKETFPELQHYQDVKFRICDKSNYNPKDADSKWYSIDLKKTSKEAEYVVSFIGLDKRNKTIKRKYFVNPVFEGKDYKLAMDEYNDKFKLFEEKKTIQKELLAIELKKQEELEKEQLENQKEREKNREIRDREIEQLRIENGGSLTNGQDPGHTYPSIVKGLEISGFGVYNCDQVYRMKNTVTFYPFYVDESGKEIKYPGVLSLINTKVNAAYSFDPSSVTFDLDAKNVFLLFTEFGKLYLLDENEFKKEELISSGKVTFKMKEVTEKIRSTNDLAVYLGFSS